MPEILVPESQVSGKLYLVPTPIGNLDDMTLRAIKVLKEVDIIACENITHSKKLLSHFFINKQLVQYHEQGNFQSKLNRILYLLREGKNVALITSAGTPGISDPAFALTRECISQNIPIECLPGPTALIPALVISGLPCHRFVFEGFLPQKGRKKRLIEISNELRTTILYESPKRLIQLLEELLEYCESTRPVCIVRELSKHFEEVIRGQLLEVYQLLRNRIPIQGEIVVLLAGKERN